MEPHLSNIRIYPIKSLDPVETGRCRVGVRSLLNDRAFAMLRKDGSFVNGKSTGQVNILKAEFDNYISKVTFSRRNEEDRKATFNLEEDKEAIEEFLSDFFGEEIFFLNNKEGRLMDIPDESAVTIIAEETIKSLAEEMNEADSLLRLRFRANLEIANVPAFWEEKLAVLSETPGVKFRIGDVRFIGVSIRARCNVPPRNPYNGELNKSFIRKMITYRSKTAPSWSHVEKLQSLYHLTINTFIPDSELGKEIKTGDEVILSW